MAIQTILQFSENFITFVRHNQTNKISVDIISLNMLQTEIANSMVLLNKNN